MNIIGRLCLMYPMFLFSSIVFSGCTAHETTLEPTLSKSISSPDMLTAGLKAIVPNESKNTNTSLIFFISNGTEVDKELLIWSTPVEQPLSADIFSVQFNGVNLDYQGRMIKRRSPMPEHYRTVKAGETIETIVDISNYYEMSPSGSYTVDLDPVVIDGTHQLNNQTPIIFTPNTLTLTVP